MTYNKRVYEQSKRASSSLYYNVVLKIYASGTFGSQKVEVRN